MDGIEAFIAGFLVLGALVALLLMAPVAVGVGGIVGLALAAGMVH
jgi:hypothetical protein